MSDRDPRQRARAAALRFIAYRPRTEAEVRYRLRRRFTEPVVADAIASLRALDLLNDAKFAREWTESRSARRPRSARAITRELLTKGVDETVASMAVQDVDDDDAGYRAGQKYAKTSTRLDLATFQRRLLAYLQRRSFSQAVCRRVIMKLTAERTADSEPEATTEDTESVRE